MWSVHPLRVSETDSKTEATIPRVWPCPTKLGDIASSLDLLSSNIGGEASVVQDSPCAEALLS